MTLCGVSVVARDAGPGAVELPTEFRIFAAGKIPTQNGETDLFDSKAAAAVMAEYQKWGVDLIVDLEHDTVNEEAKANRSDASDARGHFGLELRDGELWAVNVKWTPDGARRLTEKTQRYISPLFKRDKKTGRILRLLNVALVSMPATNDAAPLVAASALARRDLVGSVSEQQSALQAVLAALYPGKDGAPPNVWVCDLYDGQVVFDRAGMLYAQPFTYADGVATLSGTPVRVVRTYTPAKQAAQARAARYVANVRSVSKGA